MFKIAHFACRFLKSRICSGATNSTWSAFNMHIFMLLFSGCPRSLFCDLGKQQPCPSCVSPFGCRPCETIAVGDPRSRFLDLGYHKSRLVKSSTRIASNPDNVVSQISYARSGASGFRGFESLQYLRPPFV